MNLSSKIEAVLFWKGEPIKIKKVAKILNSSEEEIVVALKELEGEISNRGITLIQKDDEVALGTNPSIAPIIDSLTKEELSRDLGRAGLETIAIILYKAPVSRKEIDFIRGVNSTFILRNLLMRGLVERVQNKRDLRTFLYRPSFDLISYIGLKKLEDLPDFIKTKQEIDDASRVSEAVEQETRAQDSSLNEETDGTE